MSSPAIAQDFCNTADDGILIGLPTERSAQRQLPGSVDAVLRTIAALASDLIETVIEQRTASGFIEAMNASLPKYAQLVIAFSRVIASTVPRANIDRLSAESLSELEADIRAQGLECFGPFLSDRAMFTVWTLRKTVSLIEIAEKHKQPAAAVDEEAARRHATEFLYHALRARFSIDCLTLSMQTKRPIYPDVVPAVDDGLRSAVNAYAWAKQAVDLVAPSDQEAVLPDYWTDDDELLLKASMDDLTRVVDDDLES